MKKLFALVLSAFCFVPVLAGCSPENPETPVDPETPTVTYSYPKWLGSSTGATTSVTDGSPIVVSPGTNEVVATKSKYTVDENDPTIVRLQETAISFQAVLQEGETEFNWDLNSETNNWAQSHVYVDINLTGSRFDMLDTDLDTEEDSLPMTHRMFLRIARYGNTENDQHPYLDPETGEKSNYLCSLFYDRTSIVCFSTTESHFRGTETYAWMQKLLAGEKVYLKWQVVYHFVPDEETQSMIFDYAEYAIYFGNAGENGPEWIDAPSLFDPVNVFKIDGVQDPNGDVVNPDITGNVFSTDNFLNNGQYVCDTTVHVSPNANFDVQIDDVILGE